MGRPLKEISATEFEKLCGLQCTQEEICGWFGVSDKTLENWCKREYKQNFSEIYAEKRGLGKISLRRAQFRLAEKSAAMAIFLGKNYLGQKDSVEYEDKESIARLDAILQGMKDAAKPQTE
jgi:hypothetical protein